MLGRGRSGTDLFGRVGKRLLGVWESASLVNEAKGWPAVATESRSCRQGSNVGSNTLSFGQCDPLRSIARIRFVCGKALMSER
jgi:hypothetical protein